jgi:hypothetical protein
MTTKRNRCGGSARPRGGGLGRWRPHRAERGAAGRGGADDGQQHGVRPPLPSAFRCLVGWGGRPGASWGGLEVGDDSGRPRVSRRRRWLIRDEWSRCDGERGWGLRGLVFRDSFGLWCGLPLPLPALMSLRAAASQQLRAPHVLSRGRFRVSCSSNTGLVGLRRQRRERSLVHEYDSFSTPVRCQREQRKSLSMPPPPFFLSRKIHCHR